jgi:serine/threonine protein kinase
MEGGIRLREPCLRLSTVRLALAEVSAQMAGASPRDPNHEQWKQAVATHLQEMPRVEETAWSPFPQDRDGPRRRIHLLVTGRGALGEGTFGIVFPVVYELPLETEEDKADPRVVLAAMKMLPLLKEHGLELINLLAANDLVRAGCTPCIVRMIDSFCLTTAATVTRCEMPPHTWMASFWNLYDRFIYRKRKDLVDYYGADVLRSSGVNDKEGTARLNAGATVGFIFTELSPTFLLATVRKLGGGSPPPLPSLASSASVAATHVSSSSSSVIDAAQEAKHDRELGITDLYSLSAHMFMRLQALDAMHATGILHRDIHAGNFMRLATNVFRTSYCALESAEGRRLRSEWLGEAGQTRPNDRRLGESRMLYFRGSDEEHNRYVIGIDTVRSNGVSCVIDLGAARRPTFAEGAMGTREQAAPIMAHFLPYFFGAAATFTDHMRLPHPRTLSGSFSERYGRDRTPAFCVLRHETTLVYSRCTEQLNPLVVPGLVGRTEFTSNAHYLAFHSEFSDIYSLVAELAALILGYHPFAPELPASTASSSQSLRQSAKSNGGISNGIHCRSRGPRIRSIAPLSSSTAVARPGRPGKPALAHIEPLRESGSLPASRSCYQPSQAAVYSGRLWPIVPPADPVLGLSDMDQERLLIEALNRGEIIQFRKDYHELEGELLKFMQLRIVEERKRGAPAEGCPFLGNTDDELRAVAHALAVRIDAVGLPNELDGLRNTFFYDFFRDTSKLWKIRDHIAFYDEDATRRQHRGWLYLALHETLTNKWGVEKVVATDLADCIVDGLSFDVADRPSLSRLMRCNLFVQTLAVRVENRPSAAALAALGQAPEEWFTTKLLWSSLRPRMGTLPDDYLDAAKPPFNILALEQRFLDSSDTDDHLLDLSTARARERFTALHWTFSAIRNVARLRFFRFQHARLPGFLTRQQSQLMRLLPSESALAALYNFRTGLLDFFDGSVCVRYGKEKSAQVVEDLVDLPHLQFKSQMNMELYVRFAAEALQHHQESLPSWPFVRASELKRQREATATALSSSSSSSSSPTTRAIGSTRHGDAEKEEEEVEVLEEEMLGMPARPTPLLPSPSLTQERPAKRPRLDQ